MSKYQELVVAPKVARGLKADQFGKENFGGLLISYSTDKATLSSAKMLASQWWSESNLKKAVDTKIEKNFGASTPIGKMNAAVATEINKNKITLQEKWNNNSACQWIERQAERWQAGYEGHRITFNFIWGGCILAGLLAATVLAPEGAPVTIALAKATATSFGMSAVMSTFSAFDAAADYYAINDKIEGASGEVLEAASESLINGAKVGPVVLVAEALPYIGNMEAFLTAPEAVETGTALAETVAEEVVEAGKNTGVGNPVEVAGRGSTGRTVPNSLEEQMAMHQVQSNPLEGAVDMSKIKNPIIMNDSRWMASDGWVKMSNNVDGIEIHFVYNVITGAFDDFKFK